MFKNPLKYQQGGQTPTQEQQKLLEAFIEWLPKKVKEFQGMQPEQIAQALDGMSKTDEGKKQLQQLMMQFQQEMQEGSQSFKQGGKIYDFVCKHAKGGKAGCGCKEEGGNISKDQHGLSSGRFDIPFGAYMKTYFNKRNTPNVGAATRRSFGYSTSDGNEYYLEDANIGRNSVDTWVNITPKKDTIIMQKLPSNHINDLEDYQMETIMQRMRPDIKRVNNQENGGKVEKAETGMSKLEALKKAKETHGYNNSQARLAYANAKNALRGQGLRGRELRQSAREMISRGVREPIVAIDPTSSVQGVAIATLPNGSPLPAQTIIGSREPRTGNNYDNLTFSNAFLAARNKAGGDNGVFNWRGGKYTTKLNTKNDNRAENNKYSMPNLAPVVIEDPELVIPEFEPIPNNTPELHYATSVYPGLENMLNPQSADFSWPTSTWLANQNNISDLFAPYGIRDKQSRVLMVGSPSLYKPSAMAFKNGGKVEKAQEGSVLDYYSNKWSNDLNRLKQGWNRFKESAPGKVLSTFMPNPNSEAGMLGAAAPVGKISSLGKAASKLDDEVKVLGYYDDLGNFIKTEGDDIVKNAGDYINKSKWPEFETPNYNSQPNFIEPDYSGIDFNNLVTPHADLGDWISGGIIGGALGGAAYAGAKMAKSETKDKKENKSDSKSTEKKQSGGLLDFYKNKWKSDFFD